MGLIPKSGGLGLYSEDSAMHDCRSVWELDEEGLENHGWRIF